MTIQNDNFSHIHRKNRILFVCLGNICRSPAAEEVMRTLVKKYHREDEFEIDSAGLLDYHQGELADPRMRQHAARRGYRLTHLSRPVRSYDLDDFDYVIGMDEGNIRGLRNLANSEAVFQKIHYMTEFCQRIQADHVPDPYYGGEAGFEYVLDLLEDACEGLLNQFQPNKM